MPATVIEHDLVHRRFERTLARGRLASTYLFVGPVGVGKRTFALKLAAAVLCPHTPLGSLAACGACESCRLMETSGHPDLLEASLPAGKSTLPLGLFIGEGDKRNREGLCHDIALKPYLGQRRVAIIDDADALSMESANCLLKTLEEPPPRSLLILISTSLSRQLPTIRSRSQIVRFGPLSVAAVGRVLQEKSLVQEDEDPRPLAEASGGSVSAALQARDADSQEFQQQFVRLLAAPRFDPVRLAKDATAFANDSGDDAGSRRTAALGLMAVAMDHFRGQMMEQPAPDQAEECLRSLDACLDAEVAVTRNANLSTVLQAWLHRLWQVKSRS